MNLVATEASVSGHHGHHAHSCGGLDHHRGEYTDEQRADLDRVLGFNARLAAAIDSGVDVAATLQVLDPDPLRYMWVDEGQGRIAETLERAQQTLDRSAMLAGHTRGGVAPVAGSQRASRPSVAAAVDGSLLCCWVEWLPGEGDVLQSALLKPDGSPAQPSPVRLSSEVGDIFGRSPCSPPTARRGSSSVRARTGASTCGPPTATTGGGADPNV